MECPTCSEPLLKGGAIPRLLTKCGHTICHKCLKTLIERVDSFHIKCPFCSTDYTIEEARSLPNNYFLLNLIQDQIPATPIYPIDDKACHFHAFIKKDFYCKTDKVYLCSKCLLAGDHLGHDMVHVEDELDLYRKRLGQYTRLMDEKCHRLEINKEKFMKHLGEYQTLTKMRVTSMEEKFKKLVHKLTKRKDEVLREFNTSTMTMNKYLKDKITILNKKQELLKEYIAESKIVSSKICGRTADLKEIEDLVWEERVIEEISKDLSREFGFEKNNKTFEDVMREIESMQFSFAQTPFFVFNEDLFKKYSENFLHIASFDYGLDENFKLENDIFMPSDFYRSVKQNHKKSQSRWENHSYKKVKTNSGDLFGNIRNETNQLNLLNQQTNEGDIVKEEEIENQPNQINIITPNHINLKIEDCASQMIENELEKAKEIIQCSAIEDQGKQTTLMLSKKMVKLEAIGPSGNRLPFPNIKLIKQEEGFPSNIFSNESSQQKLSTSTAASNFSSRLVWSLKHEAEINNSNVTLRDPFSETGPSQTVICLLGQNNKALYITENGESELLSLDLQFRTEEDKKNYLLRNFACCVLFDRNKVLYTGGGPSNETYLLEFHTKRKVTVTSFPKMGQKRCWHGMIYSKPYAYIIGGYDGKNRLKECEKINLEEGVAPSFEVIQPMNEARSQFGYTLCNNTAIYVVGGLSNSKKGGLTDTIEKYDIEKDKWILLEVRLPLKLCGVSCGYFDDEKKIKIFGGSDSIKKSTKLVFELEIDSKNAKLRECNAMLKKRQMNNKVFYKEGELYLIGGTVENDCEVWRKFSTDEEMIMEKSLFSYEKVIKGDLNNFCGFIL